MSFCVVSSFAFERHDESSGNRMSNRCLFLLKSLGAHQMSVVSLNHRHRIPVYHMSTLEFNFEAFHTQTSRLDNEPSQVGIVSVLVRRHSQRETEPGKIVVHPLGRCTQGRRTCPVEKCREDTCKNRVPSSDQMEAHNTQTTHNTTHTRYSHSLLRPQCARTREHGLARTEAHDTRSLC